MLVHISINLISVKLILVEDTSTKPIMKTFEIVSDPERIKVILDKTRKNILAVMKRGISRDGKLSFEFTVAEISELLNTSPQRIYHHVDKLVEYNFLVKSREVKKVRSILTYYQRTARAFIISFSENDTYDNITMKNYDWFENLSKIFNLDLKDKEIKKLANLYRKFEIKESGIYETITSKISDDIDFESMVDYVWFIRNLMILTDPEIKQTLENIAEILIPKFIKI